MEKKPEHSNDIPQSPDELTKFVDRGFDCAPSNKAVMDIFDFMVEERLEILKAG